MNEAIELLVTVWAIEKIIGLTILGLIIVGVLLAGIIAAVRGK